MWRVTATKPKRCCIWSHLPPSAFHPEKKPVAFVQSRILTYQTVATFLPFHVGSTLESKLERHLIPCLSLQVNWWTQSEGQSQQLHLFINQRQIISSQSSPWLGGMELAGGVFSLCWHLLQPYPRPVNQERPYCKVCKHMFWFPAVCCTPWVDKWFCLDMCRLCEEIKGKQRKEWQGGMWLSIDSFTLVSHHGPWLIEKSFCYCFDSIIYMHLYIKSWAHCFSLLYTYCAFAFPFFMKNLRGFLFLWENRQFFLILFLKLEGKFDLWHLWMQPTHFNMTIILLYLSLRLIQL
jgi:hypothetical protein